MQRHFKCAHCGQHTLLNPRLKGKQRYCSSKPCQQARKNKWEKERIKKDKTYRKKRYAQKALWRTNKPVDQYQKQYRESHPHYVITNRAKQKNRNKTQSGLSHLSTGEKIVKTDTLFSGSLLPGGLYTIQPYCPDASEKIVKTDALIVSLQSYQGLQGQKPIKT